MYAKSILENGIRVVTETMPSVRSVSMGIIVDTGLKDELSGKNGQAHLLEHLMFRGTCSRDSMQIARIMDEAGGRVGGFTTRDYTCYSATVLDDYRTYAMDLLGDILLNSVFIPEDIEREKQAILREIDALYDMPDHRADALLKAHAWSNHPMGMPVTGNAETVSRLTREDVIGFFHTHYLPDRMIVAAAGNLDHEDFVIQVRDALWRLLGESVRVPNPHPGHNPGIAVECMPVNHVYFSIGIKAVPFAHSSRYPLHVLNKILGDGISSRLFRRIREEQGLAYDISSELHAYRDGGLLVVEGSTKPGVFKKVLNRTMAVISQLLSGDQPVQDEELLRAKNQIKGAHLLSGEDTHTRMSRLGTQELYFGRHICSNEVLEQINAVDIQALDIMNQADLADSLAKATVAIVGPEVGTSYEAAAYDAMRANLH